MFKNKLLFVIINFIKIELNQNTLNTVKPPNTVFLRGKENCTVFRGPFYIHQKKTGEKMVAWYSRGHEKRGLVFRGFTALAIKYFDKKFITHM